jgi:hypothetical protein
MFQHSKPVQLGIIDVAANPVAFSARRSLSVPKEHKHPFHQNQCLLIYLYQNE